MNKLTISFYLLLIAGCTQLPPSTEYDVRLIRDEWGTPHIYADSIYGLYYGYGHAIAQDRLFQMEMARRSTQGKVAEVLGAGYIDYDRKTRELFKPASIRKQLSNLETADRDVFEGYAAGINAWLTEIAKDRDNLQPKQFFDQGFEPRPWDAYDVAMIFIGTMNNRFGDFNTELDNLAIYQSLVSQHGEYNAARLFDLVNPRFTDTGSTTVPRADWSRPAYDSLAGTAAHELPTLASVPPAAVTTGFSNCYILGDEKVEGGGSIMINGPQFGWFNPSYVYSIGLHGAGINVAGNSPFGYPMIMFGHNGRISWGSTWGVSDIVDIYAHRLNPENTGQYWYRGGWRDLEQRSETIAIKDSNSIEHPVYRSVYGPIIHLDKNQGVAYAKHRAWDGGELDTLLAWLHATWAPDYESWKAEAEKSAINVNMYFSDVNGNIGYFHGGQFPIRVSGHDNRLPADGDGSMDWLGRQDIDLANPNSFNSSTGFLANWNNKPGDGVMNPDHHFASWSRADRNDILDDALSPKEKFTADEAWSIVEHASHADIIAAYFLPIIDNTVSGSIDEQLKPANQLLQNWDQQLRDTDNDGFYDEPATAILWHFVDQLVELSLKDDLGDAWPFFAASINGSANIPAGIKAMIQVLDGESSYDVFNGKDPEAVVLKALALTVAELKIEHGSLEKARVAVNPHNYSFRNFMGIPQAGDNETMVWPVAQNRGTENNMILMKPGQVVAWEVTPPGQSGFVHRDGTPSEHYDDQFQLYHEFGRKRMWFYRHEVEARKTSEQLLRYQGR